MCLRFTVQYNRYCVASSDSFTFFYVPLLPSKVGGEGLGGDNFHTLLLWTISDYFVAPPRRWALSFEMEVSVVTPTPPLAHRMLMMHFHLSGELKKNKKLHIAINGHYLWRRRTQLVWGFGGALATVALRRHETVFPLQLRSLRCNLCSQAGHTKEARHAQWTSSGLLSMPELNQQTGGAALCVCVW